MRTDQSVLLESCSALNDTDYSVVLKRKCREIEQSSPSMMWKRSIVQARSYAHGTAALALLLAVLGCACTVGRCADLVIEIPGSVGGEAGAEGGEYRLDYRPPDGTPAPNFTVAARASTISFQGLPGTKYHFMLYYSNATFSDLLTWNQTIITAPEPPTNLTVTLGRNKQATISWSPPEKGEYTGFRFKVIPLTERVEGGARNVSVEGAGNWSLALRDLSPGATYQLHAFTTLHDKESAAYASRNFTTKPNTPGKFIVWFRNETTLLVLWQPPYPPGAYTHYKVSIVPPDARESELYVEKEGEPPGPAQAAFKGLVPGRAYNISVQTVSEPEISAPTTAQYRTVPLRPRNVTVPASGLHETSFTVTWLPPLEESEFEKYQVSVMGGGGGGGGRRAAPAVISRGEPLSATFDALEPGAPYSVTVKTMSGKVTSWPATTDLTLKPLPVQNLSWQHVDGSEGILVSWSPANGSTQDEYKVSYHESGPMRDDSNALSTTDTSLTLKSLLPGRNYTIIVCAVSRGVVSAERVASARSRPLAPVLLWARPAAAALALAWRSDVTSRQDSYQLRVRRAPGGGGGGGGGGGAPRTLNTTETSATIEDLFPGAVYEIQLAAISYGLSSERLTILKPVRPLPPAELRVEAATMRGARVAWEKGPGAGALGGFVLRYAPDQQDTPPATHLLPPSATHQEITNLTPGERYIITLDTVSEDAAGETVESEHPLTAEHTVRPSPVSNVLALADAHNVTLEWPAALGRVDAYLVQWEPLERCGEAGAGGARRVPPPGRAALGGLAPGCPYRLHIAAASHNLTSDLFTMDTRTRPLIQSEMTIVNESGDGDDEDTLSTTLKVVYTPTPEWASRFDTYRFRLEGGAAPRWEARAATAPRAPVVFAALVPGRLYHLTMWTVSGNVTSHPVTRHSRLYPRPITELNVTDIGAREVTLLWDKPLGDFTEFQVQYLTGPDQLQTKTTDALKLKIEDLKPHRNYTFTVVVVAGDAGSLRSVSRARSVEVKTLQAVPEAPDLFEVRDATPTSLQLAWKLDPEHTNGDLQGFILRYAPQEDLEHPMMLEFPPDAVGGSVTGLRAGGTYVVWVSARTGAGEGAAARVTQRLHIGAPPPPAPGLVPREAARSSTTVAVRFAGDYFSAANGNVTAYTLVLAEAPRNDTPARLPSWRDVHALPEWPPYQVTEPYYPFHSAAIEEFTIGSERCDAGGRAYCNGPLKPGTKYYVKLRAFTAPDKFADTDYTVVHTEVDHTGWIVGACVAGALAAGAAGVLLALRRRRAAAPPAPPQPVASRPVRVADFLDHYRLMSADSDFRFSEEFEELKHVGRDQPCTAADLPVNRPKNRFTNILPYDHSRYKLQPVDDEEGSDYINANYVPGFASPREFIVTQGPLHSTRDDFWRMVWESGARAIVMLTRCVEKGREKCDRYWPFDTRPVYYGDICVTALNESRYADWTVSELGVARGADQRVVQHFHFTTWPDFGVPSPPTTLARFVRLFRERCAALRPVVVHCSAGVGRSGTFVTLDTALRQLQHGATALDVFGMVHALRRERVFMVQTEQQYIAVHQCLVAALEGQDLQPEPHTHHHNQAFEDDEGIAESGM